MSKYMTIQTEFLNGESLVKALTDVGVIFERAEDLRENSVTLKTHWGQQYGGIDTPVALAISRENLKAHLHSGAYDGVGWSWNGAGYDLVQDHYDQHNDGVTNLLNQIRQRYAYHEVSRQAHAKGYTVRESYNNNGTINLVLVRR